MCESSSLLSSLCSRYCCVRVRVRVCACACVQLRLPALARSLARASLHSGQPALVVPHTAAGMGESERKVPARRPAAPAWDEL